MLPCGMVSEKALVKKLLRALHTRPHVRGAVLYDADGRLCTSHRRSDLPAGEPFAALDHESVIWAGNQLTVARAILSDGKSLGRIQIEIDLQDLQERTTRPFRVTAAIAAGLLLVVYFLAGLLGHSITAPIRLLAHARSCREAKRSGAKLRCRQPLRRRRISCRPGRMSQRPRRLTCRTCSQTDRFTRFRCRSRHVKRLDESWGCGNR